MVIGFIQAVNLFSSPFKILISWFFLRRVGTKNSFLWISLSSLKIWLSKAKQWDWMKPVCEKGEGLQANILACVYLMGKNLWLNLLGHLGICLIIFSSTFLEKRWNWRKNYGKAYVLGLESNPLGSQYSSSCFSAKILVETSPRTISWIFSFLGTFCNNLTLSYSKTLKLCHLLTNVQIPRLTPFLNVLWIPEWCCWQPTRLVQRVTKERFVSAGVFLTGSQLLLCIQEWFQAEVSTFWAGSVSLWGKNH